MTRYAARCIKKTALRGGIAVMLFILVNTVFRVWGEGFPEFVLYVLFGAAIATAVFSTGSLVVMVIQFCYVVISLLTGCGWKSGTIEEGKKHRFYFDDVEYREDDVYSYWTAPFMKKFVEGVVR